MHDRERVDDEGEGCSMVKAYVKMGNRERKVKSKKEIKERTKIGLLYSIQSNPFPTEIWLQTDA